MRIDASDAFHRAGARHQVVLNRNGTFAYDEERCLQQIVHGAVDRPFGGVLYRNNTVGGITGLNLSKDLFDTARGHSDHTGAELTNHRLFAERSARTEVSHFQFGLKAAAGAHDLTPDGH